MTEVKKQHAIAFAKVTQLHSKLAEDLITTRLLKMTHAMATQTNFQDCAEATVEALRMGPMSFAGKPGIWLSVIRGGAGSARVARTS